MVRWGTSPEKMRVSPAVVRLALPEVAGLALLLELVVLLLTVAGQAVLVEDDAGGPDAALADHGPPPRLQATMLTPLMMVELLPPPALDRSPRMGLAVLLVLMMGFRAGRRRSRILVLSARSSPMGYGCSTCNARS